MPAIIELIPNVAQIVTDKTAGTVTIQTWNSTSSVWDTQFTVATATGDITMAATVTASGAFSASAGATITGTMASSGPVNYTTGATSIAGTTAGTIYWTAPLQGAGYKKVAVFLDAYENDTTTAQTITFPAAFTYTPNIYNPGAVPGVTTTTTTLSIDPDTTTAYTNWIIVEGF